MQALYAEFLLFIDLHKQLTRGRQKFLVKTMFKITFCALIVPTKGSNNHPTKDYFKFSI